MIALPALFMAALWWASSQPGNSLPDAPFWSADKVVHLAVYTILGALVVRCWAWRWPLAALFAAAYGAVDEYHQSFVPGRTASWGDLLADAGGAWLGAWAAQPRARHP